MQRQELAQAATSVLRGDRAGTALSYLRRNAELRGFRIGNIWQLATLVAKRDRAKRDV